MTKTSLLLAALCSLLALCSCNPDKSRKPLVGGVYGTSEAVPKSENNIQTTGQDARYEACDSLELPALRENSGEIILRRKGYTASYDPQTLLPVWVAWELTPDRLVNNVKRPTQAFHEDTDVPEPRALTYDYINSGYDRGHMCPAADNKWDATAMYESFLFTNICPQNRNLNAGDWNEMENQCRKWVKKYGRIYIVCGPILYKCSHKTIGKNRVVVPEAFFKVVLCMKDKPKAIGFIYKNAAGNRRKGDYVNSVDQIERITGIDFFPSLPDETEDEIEAKADFEAW
ncbi:MAG: DNA/RNA non-specific endonuclease [Prevotella sp.]